MPTYEQRTTDLVDVTDLPGGVSLLTFAWETRKTGNTFHAPEAFYARTSQVTDVLTSAQANGTGIVHALADSKNLTRYQVLRRGENIPDILATVPWEIVRDQTWRRGGGLPSVWVGASEVGTDVNPADLYSWGGGNDGYDGVLYSFTTGEPVTRPLLVDSHYATADRYDLDRLAPLLAAHPWVLRIAVDEGYSGYYDHVPASLQVIVRLPQDVFEQMLFGGGLGSSNGVGETLFWAPLGSGENYPLGPDPLGIADTKRTTAYETPKDDWQWGEEFPALIEQYGTYRDLDDLT